MPVWNSVMKCVHWSAIPLQWIKYDCLKAQKTQVNPTPHTGGGFTKSPEMKNRSTMTTKTSEIIWKHFREI